MKNAINWFEIPVKDFNRAKKFYGAVLGSKINDMPHPTLKYGVLPSDMEKGAVGGAIVEGEGYEVSKKGPVIYLNGGDDLNIPLAKVEKAGGKIVQQKTSIGENGFIAYFTDSEGNKVAFHSMN
ncbi:MAG TPA: VOC family protein [Chitinophagaceae bacterium]|jgi:hypothetical protein|nr:VOC family protein [Chitinophagaceae bacterium]